MAKHQIEQITLKCLHIDILTQTLASTLNVKLQGPLTHICMWWTFVSYVHVCVPYTHTNDRYQAWKANVNTTNWELTTLLNINKCAIPQQADRTTDRRTSKVIWDYPPLQQQHQQQQQSLKQRTKLSQKEKSTKCIALIFLTQSVKDSICVRVSDSLWVVGVCVRAQTSRGCICGFLIFHFRLVQNFSSTYRN